jgi:hypothetical protein
MGISRREALKAALALPAVAMGAAALPVEAAVAVPLVNVPMLGAVYANYTTIDLLESVYKPELVEELRVAIKEHEFKHPGGRPYGIEFKHPGGRPYGIEYWLKPANGGS